MSPERHTQAREGVFYVIRLGRAWCIHALRYEDPEKTWDHSEFWQRDMTPLLADAYRLNALQREELSMYPYGFPRGRVTKAEQGWRVYHGADFAKFVSKRSVETVFAVGSVAKWETDDHERCLAYDRDAVCRLLGVQAIWPAADG